MTRTEIYSRLRKMYPEATNICQDDFGNWDVEIEDEFEILSITYTVVDGKLIVIAEMTVEQ